MKVYSAVRVEDMNVPEAHRGLHEFLYDGEDEHELEKPTKVSSKELSADFNGEKTFLVEEWIKISKTELDEKVAGVYAVLDTQNLVQYVGFSRNIALSLRNHLKTFGGNIVQQVRIKSVIFPKKEELSALQSDWISSLGYTPVGNSKNEEGIQLGWESSSRGSGAVMTVEEKNKYIETKTKLRKAMADATLISEAEADDIAASTMSNEAKRANLKAAVEDDNWSAIIAEQSAETEYNDSLAFSENPNPVPTEGTITSTHDDIGGEAVEEEEEEDMDAEDEEDRNIDILSPFEDGKNSPEQRPLQEPANRPPELELTPENVDIVLDEVRPYLIADGGNIEVVEIDTEKRGIYLRLQGACGSCPSSTVTMKMGVERVLREKFSNLTTIEALAPLVEDEYADLSDEEKIEKLNFSVGQKLEEVMPAIRGLGADSKIVKIEASGMITLAYKGPEKVKLGIVYALKSIEGVSDVTTVSM